MSRLTRNGVCYQQASQALHPGLCRESAIEKEDYVSLKLVSLDLNAAE